MVKSAVSTQRLSPAVLRPNPFVEYRLWGISDFGCSGSLHFHGQLPRHLRAHSSRLYLLLILLFYVLAKSMKD